MRRFYVRQRHISQRVFVMRATLIGLENLRASRLYLLIIVAALVPMTSFPGAAADDVEAALQKANAYIETAKATERAVDSWERYREWVSMKTGPTGKERYIDYGMYDLHDVAELLKEARAAAAAKPSVAQLDAAMVRYIDAYEALAPDINKAAAYYDRKGYESDNAAEGQALHKKMVPLATGFLTEREAMMPELRAFVREVEGQELAAMEAGAGRKAAWQVGNVLHSANRVLDVFPRIRPQPMSSDAIDEMMKDLGPETPGEKFDQIIAGVEPPNNNIVIDVKGYGEALEKYSKAVDEFDGFGGEKPEEFHEFKGLPRQLLDMLREFQKPLIKSEGRQFGGDAQMFGRIVEAYFNMFNEGNGMWRSQLRFLP
jgi:Protein of unknown function (DUF3829)